ncbi:MFS general substrate transporter [Mycena sp. CBHHK59/15]|nr:MFS general substrate transporter [Mycena sp. CBHHK59/15]
MRRAHWRRSRWLVLLGTFGYAYTFGVYEDFYAREYLTNRSPSSIAWIGSFQLMMPFLLGPLAGKVFDDGGFHAIEIIGCSIFAFSVFMLSLAKPGQYYQMAHGKYSQGVGMGIGLGLTFLPTLGIVVHHFKRRRGLASGIVLSGSSVGATFFPISQSSSPSLPLSTRVRGAIRATGAIVPPCLVLGNLLMRTRLPPRSKRANQATPDVKAFFRDAAYMWAILGAFLCLLGLYFPVIYIQLFSVQHSVDGTLSFYSVAIMNGASGASRILINHLGDVYGVFNVQILCSFFAGALIWGMLGIHNGASLVIISILYGALSGAWLSLCFACFASLARGPEEVGARAGIALALVSVGTLVSAPIQGALLTDRFVWINPVGFAGSMMFAGASMFLVTRMLRARLTGTWRV